MSRFVLDASTTLAWLFDDESDQIADIALMALGRDGAIVPQLWHLEIRNTLIVAERRGRITFDDAQERLASLTDLPIELDDQPDYDRAYALARKYKLSYYDSVYLELAARLKLPLATLDKHLSGAALAGENLPML